MEEVKFPAEIFVRAGKRKNEVSFEDGRMIVSVKARAEKNEANREATKFLSKHFKRQIRIVSGMRSRKKVIDMV